jgi:hypothetical protein
LRPPAENRGDEHPAARTKKIRSTTMVVSDGDGSDGDAINVSATTAFADIKRDVVGRNSDTVLPLKTTFQLEKVSRSTLPF